MIPVFRRLLLVSAFVLALGSCADEARDVAASVGDRALNVDEIADYQTVVLGIPTIDEAVLNRPSAQAAVTTWARGAVQLHALEEAGIGPTAAELLEVEQLLNQQIQEGRAPELSPSDAIYDDVVDILVLNWVPRVQQELTTEFQTTVVAEAIDDELFISRRVGVWDEASGSVIDPTG